MTLVNRSAAPKTLFQAEYGLASSGTAAGLTGNDYTNRGWVLGLRYKFDEDLFKKNEPAVNRTIDPNVMKP